jgi:hypothetical protein
MSKRARLAKKTFEIGPFSYESAPAAPVREEIAAPTHDRIAVLAYEMWQRRGCPAGSPEDDWYRAENHLQGRALGAAAFKAS